MNRRASLLFAAVLAGLALLAFLVAQRHRTSSENHKDRTTPPSRSSSSIQPDSNADPVQLFRVRLAEAKSGAGSVRKMLDQLIVLHRLLLDRTTREGVVRTLGALVEDPTSDVHSRALALLLLGGTPSVEARRHLETACGDPDERILFWAAYSLSMHPLDERDPMADADTLVQRYFDGCPASDWVGLNAKESAHFWAMALSDASFQDFGAALKTFLKENYTPMSERGWVQKCRDLFETSFGAIQDPAAVRALSRVYGQGKDREIRLKALYALDPPGGTEHEFMMETIRAVISRKEEDSTLRAASISVLASAGQSSDRSFLLHLMTTELRRSDPDLMVAQSILFSVEKLPGATLEDPQMSSLIRDYAALIGSSPQKRLLGSNLALWLAGQERSTTAQDLIDELARSTDNSVMSVEALRAYRTYASPGAVLLTRRLNVVISIASSAEGSARNESFRTLASLATQARRQSLPIPESLKDAVARLQRLVAQGNASAEEQAALKILKDLGF